MKTFEIICLANSRKLGGRCVAGLLTNGSGWVRPVSPTDGGTLYEHHYRLADGSPAQVMDVITIEVSQSNWERHHPEDWLVTQTPWQLVRRGVAIREYRDLLRTLLVQGPELLGNCLNRVEYEYLQRRPARASLALVPLQRADLRVTASSNGNRQLRAEFSLKGVSYNLAVTDPTWERALAAAPEKSVHHLQRILLTISLGEPYQGSCYKLVAAIIPRK